jgi:hypothetical protein
MTKRRTRISLRARTRIRHTISLLLLCAGPAAAQSPERGDDPFARRGWHVQAVGNAAVEAWNYNISHEELWGGVPGITYGLGKGVTLTTTFPLYYVDQRGPDAWLIGITIGMRGRVVRVRRASVFWEFDLGVSKADLFTPPRGTRFNYLAIGAAGATFPLRRGTHLLAGLKLIHISNNGLAGRHRNPDIEAIGPHVGLLIAF